MAKKPKKICPWCDSEKYASLKSSPGGQVTRCCERHIVTVVGVWHKTHEDAPVWRVIERVALGMDVLVAFADETYKGWTKGAKTLLARCGGALDLAMRVLETFFTDDRWRWHAKKCMSIYFILNNNVFAKLMSDTRGRETKSNTEDLVQERTVLSISPEALSNAKAAGRL